MIKMNNVNDYDKRNGNIVFNEKDHKYWDLTNPNANFISVTTLIDRFVPPYDKEFWSMYKALEQLVPKEDWKTVSKPLRDSHKIPEEIYTMYEFTKQDAIAKQQEILDEWQQKNEESCERGTKIHAMLENSFYKMGANCNLQKFGIGGKFVCDKGRTTLDLEDGVYPEYLISRISNDGILRLAGQIDLLVKKGHHYTIIDHKGLPLDTPIMTTNGFVLMKDLKVGDKVYDKDGNPTTITVKSKVHHNPCYKIQFDNTDSIIADKDHRWLISFKKQKTKSNPTGIKEQVMTTEELADYIDWCKENNKWTSNYIPKIYNTKPLNNDFKKLPIDPYVLGCWLGDGSKSCGILTQASNSNVWNEIQNRGYIIGNNLIHSKDRAGTESRTIMGLSISLKKLNLINNKHIPSIYLTSSYNQRLDLLRGFMDTDGYYNKVRHRFVMTTDQKWQMESMVQLCSSLGFKVSVFNAHPKCNGKTFIGWNITFSTKGVNPFLSRNQENIIYPQTDKCSFRNIKSVELVNTVPTQCIAVDSPSHTYLAGYAMIITHNTNSKIETKGFYNSTTRGTSKMKYPLNNLDDCNYNHYNLQLSTYAWMIQKKDPEAVIDDLILNWYPHEGGNKQFHMEYIKKDVIKMLKWYKKQLLHEITESKYTEINY